MKIITCESQEDVTFPVPALFGGLQRQNDDEPIFLKWVVGTFVGTGKPRNFLVPTIQNHYSRSIEEEESTLDFL